MLILLELEFENLSSCKNGMPIRMQRTINKDSDGI